MGLDMYLSKKTYVKQWDHQSPEEKYEVVVTKGGKPVDGIKAKRVKYIEEEVGYWRKANQIHRWFVDNVQDGVDNCGDYYVSSETLKELLDVCKKVQADHSLADTLLPSASGFFFGNTDYDEYYYNDVEHTIEILDKILSESDGNQDIYYSSSW
jgi:hypothetical protein